MTPPPIKLLSVTDDKSNRQVLTSLVSGADIQGDEGIELAPRELTPNGVFQLFGHVTTCFEGV